MNESDFRKQVVILSGRLYLTALQILGAREEAEDAVQDVFLKLWKNKEKLNGYESLEAIAVASVKNQCIDLIRKKKPFYTDIELNLLDKRKSTETPQKILEENEAAWLLDDIVKTMPENLRNIFIMHDIEGKSYVEVEDITGININTLRVDISRARTYLRNEFKRRKYERF